MPIRNTAAVCSVIGTGENGTWTLAEAHNSRLAPTARTIARSAARRSLPVAGQKRWARVGVKDVDAMMDPGGKVGGRGRAIIGATRVRARPDAVRVAGAVGGCLRPSPMLPIT